MDKAVVWRESWGGQLASLSILASTPVGQGLYDPYNYPQLPTSSSSAHIHRHVNGPFHFMQ